MNKLQQVIGLLRAIKNIALQGIYAETYKGMETQCVTTYRKCIATLKTISGFEEIDSIVPELTDNSTMQEVSFAVEAVLSLISEGEGPTMHVGGTRVCMPRMPHMPRMRMHMMRGHGPRSIVVDVRRRRHMRHREDVEELQDEMQEKMEEEQERFEENLEKIEDQVEELQDKIEEIRDHLEERLEEIREKYQEKIEEKMEEIEEDDEGEEEESEEKDEPKV
jgi:flagellar capping protein FliD